MRSLGTLAVVAMAGAALTAATAATALAKDIKEVGISVGSLGNPGFVIIANTATQIIHKAYPKAQVTTVGYDYDLGKQVNQIDNFIAAGADFILLNPGDPKAITPAIRKAQAAGIPVIAFDTVAEGADAAVMHDSCAAREEQVMGLVTDDAEELYFRATSQKHRDWVRDEQCPTCLSPCQMNVAAVKQVVPYVKFLVRASREKRRATPARIPAHAGSSPE